MDRKYFKWQKKYESTKTLLEGGLGFYHPIGDIATFEAFAGAGGGKFHLTVHIKKPLAIVRHLTDIRPKHSGIFFNRISESKQILPILHYL